MKHFNTRVALRLIFGLAILFCFRLVVSSAVAENPHPHLQLDGVPITIWEDSTGGTGNGVFGDSGDTPRGTATSADVSYYATPTVTLPGSWRLSYPTGATHPQAEVIAPLPAISSPEDIWVALWPNGNPYYHGFQNVTVQLWSDGNSNGVWGDSSDTLNSSTTTTLMGDAVFNNVTNGGTSVKGIVVLLAGLPSLYSFTTLDGQVYGQLPGTGR